MRLRVRLSNEEAGGGIAPPAQSQSVSGAGGEAACFLPYLDDAGRVFEPDRLVLPADEAPPTAARAWVVVEQPNDTEALWCPELVSLPGEAVHDYRQRLEEPACRTAAWRIALRAQEMPVAVVVGEGMETSPHFDALLSYLRDLMA